MVIVDNSTHGKTIEQHSIEPGNFLAHRGIFPFWNMADIVVISNTHHCEMTILKLLFFFFCEN